MDIRFTDRVDAGFRMAEELQDYANDPEALVLALPRGGVVPGAVIAKQLQIPLDVVMVKKIGHPSNPEYAIGAVSLKGRVLEEDLQVDQDYIENRTKEIRKMLKERYDKYFKGREPLDVRALNRACAAS